MEIVTYKTASARSSTVTWSSGFGRAITSIQKRHQENIRKPLRFYSGLLHCLIKQYEHCLVPPNKSIRFDKGKIEVAALILDLGHQVLGRQIHVRQRIYSWTSITLPKLFTPRELYFLVASPEDEDIVFNPTITKGGWISGSFSYPVEYRSNFSLTGMSANVLMVPFVPYRYPLNYARFISSIDLMILNEQFPEHEYGDIQILKQRNYLYLGVIKNLTWKKSVTGTGQTAPHRILKASFIGSWPDTSLPDRVALRFFNNTRFTIHCHEFAINIENLGLVKNKEKVFGTLATVCCEQIPSLLTTENLPRYLIVQFEVVTQIEDPEPLLFSSNPKLYFTGDVLNATMQLQHNPNYYDLLVHAPYDIHFYPSRCHIVILPIRYFTRGDKQILISGYQNEGFFETQVMLWAPGTPLHITLRSFSPNLILPQSTPIATLFYVERMTSQNTEQKDVIAKLSENGHFIGNLKLPRENFLHHDAITDLSLAAIPKDSATPGPGTVSSSVSPS
uniref:Protein UL31 n=1 Tax=Human herpesvirus 6B TaxID=32604 RepID=A0A2L2QE50_HHV6H|nr:hypothetical protein [Human betaherpesvirus 6B]